MYIARFIYHTGKSNLVPNSGLWKHFANGTSVVSTCCQFRSIKADALCDKQATVVGRTKLTMLATIGFRPRILAITLSVVLCVQHDEHAARRAGPSATADTCYSVCEMVAEVATPSLFSASVPQIYPVDVCYEWMCCLQLRKVQNSSKQVFLCIPGKPFYKIFA